MKNVMPAFVALVLVTAGCTDHQKIVLEELEGQGLEEIQLTPSDGPGVRFEVVAKKGDVPCKGSVAVTSMPGASSVDLLNEVVCKKPKPPKAKAAEEDPFAKDRAACDGGNLTGCTKLGLALSEAEPALRDLEGSRAAHAKACDGGELASCAHLGLMELRGLGGPADEAKAEVLYTKACDGGDMLGCTHLGRLRYINRQSKEARKLFKKSCDEGEMMGCEWLGTAWREGLGGDQDFKKARKLYDAACESGRLSACTSVGLMYMKGEGGVRSNERALEVFEATCEAGFELACDYRDRLKR